MPLQPFVELTTDGGVHRQVLNENVPSQLDLIPILCITFAHVILQQTKTDKNHGEHERPIARPSSNFARRPGSKLREKRVNWSAGSRMSKGRWSVRLGPCSLPWSQAPQAFMQGPTSQLEPRWGCRKESSAQRGLLAFHQLLAGGLLPGLSSRLRNHTSGTPILLHILTLSGARVDIYASEHVSWTEHIYERPSCSRGFCQQLYCRCHKRESPRYKYHTARKNTCC